MNTARETGATQSTAPAKEMSMPFLRGDLLFLGVNNERADKANTIAAKINFWLPPLGPGLATFMLNRKAGVEISLSEYIDTRSNQITSTMTEVRNLMYDKYNSSNVLERVGAEMAVMGALPYVMTYYAVIFDLAMRQPGIKTDSEIVIPNPETHKQWQTQFIKIVKAFSGSGLSYFLPADIKSVVVERALQHVSEVIKKPVRIANSEA